MTKETLAKADHDYHALGESNITDGEYDALRKKLGHDNKVGATVVAGRSTHTHRTRMLSMDNCWNGRELSKWLEGIGDPDVVVEYKFDGLAVSIIYIDGQLHSAATRGDSYVGEDITENVKVIGNVPTKLSGDYPVWLEIRGEVVMPLSVFSALNHEHMEATNTRLLSNPRNGAAGAVRLGNSVESKRRGLQFYAYEVLDPTSELDLYTDLVIWATGLGIPFFIPPILARSGAVARMEYRSIESQRDQLPIEIDGVVYKVNSLSVRKELTDADRRAPRWAIAYKFPANVMHSELLGVEWSVGRTGTVTPVALIESIDMNGYVISRCTLHNLDEIAALGISIGDTIEVKRGGDVIPVIVKVVESPDTAIPVQPPLVCPSCNVGPLVKTDGFSALKCLNPMCPAQVLRKLLHLVGRDAFDIQGVGEALLQELLDLKLITSAVDLWRLDLDDLKRCALVQDRRGRRILDVIAGARIVELNRLIYALGIPEVGRTLSKQLALHYGTLDGLINATAEELVELDDIGPGIAGYITSYFGALDNIRYLNSLQSIGITFAPYNPTIIPVVSRQLEGYTFCFTGVFDTPRRTLERHIVTNGGIVVKRVSATLDYLILGDKPSSKLQQALDRGITRITAVELLTLKPEIKNKMG